MVKKGAGDEEKGWKGEGWLGMIAYRFFLFFSNFRCELLLGFYIHDQKKKRKEKKGELLDRDRRVLLSFCLRILHMTHKRNSDKGSN